VIAMARIQEKPEVFGPWCLWLKRHACTH